MLVYAWWAIGAAVAAVICVRMLKALFEARSGHRRDGKRDGKRDGGGGRRWAIGLLIFAVPIGAVGAYLHRGSPQAVDRPFADVRAGWSALRTAPSDGDPHVVAAALAELAHLTPYDVRAWLALASAYRQIGRYAEAAQAMERARRLEPNQPTIAAAASALQTAIGADDGAAAALQGLAPNDPTARYLAGLDAWRRNDAQAALAAWLPLMRIVDADADWRPALHDRIEIAALALGRDAVAAAPGPGPRGVDTGPAFGARAEDNAKADVAAAETPEERLGLIRALATTLEDRLRAAPDDVDGWRRLARTYQVLGEPDRALAAFASAANVGAGQPVVLFEYAQAVRDAAPQDAPWPPLAIALLETILKQTPDHADSLWLLAIHAAEVEDVQTARTYFDRLAALDAVDPARRATAEQRLRDLR